MVAKNKTHKNFDFFIGIDQTGATNSKGEPKPLSLYIIQSQKPKAPPLFTKIKHLSHDELQRVFELHRLPLENKKVLICVDSALGLPAGLRVPIRTLITLSKTYQFQQKNYGALTAHAFFNSFLKKHEDPSKLVVNNKSTPRLKTAPLTRRAAPFKRLVETLVNANSVFNLRPFQKNIGCGTYRILKDLSIDQKWYSLWPFEQKQKAFTIAEGYPSHYWKSVFQLKTRNLETICKLTRIPFKNQDEADSYILALGAMMFQQQLFEDTPQIAKKEGWILGVPWP